MTQSSPGRVLGNLFRLRSGRGVWWVTFVTVGLVGFAYILANPLMGAPDEATHTLRAVAVAHGDLNSNYQYKSVPGARIPLTKIRVPAGYPIIDSIPGCFAFKITQPATCAAPIVELPGTADSVTSVGPYPPSYYLIAGLPSHWFSPRRAIYAMRLIGLLIGSALLASAARTLVERGSRFASLGVLGLVPALTPITMHLLAAVNPAGLEIAASMGLWVQGLALWSGSGTPTRRLIARFGVAGVVLASIRPLSPKFVILILLVCLVACGSRARFRELIRSRMVVASVTAVGAAVVGFEVFGAIHDSSTAVITSGLAGTQDRMVFLRESWNHTPEWAVQLVGRLGWLDTPLPYVVVAGWAVLVALLVVLAAVVGTWRVRFCLASLMLAVVAFPIVAEVLTGPTVGMGWQGRYTLPIAVGLPIYSAWVVSRAERLPSLVRAGLRLAIPAGIACFHLLSIARLMERYAVGLGRGLRAVFNAPVTVAFGWRVAGVVSFAACVALALAFGWISGPARAALALPSHVDDPESDAVERSDVVRDVSLEAQV